MDEQELVRINLQLPASALDSLSRLAEQLRLLTATVNSRPERAAQPAQEREESTFFDAARFQSLRPETETPEVRSTLPTERSMVSVLAAEPAVPVRSSVTEKVRTPESAGREAIEYREGPAQAGPPDNGSVPNAETAAYDIQDRYAVQPIQKGFNEGPGEIPTVRPEMEQKVPDPPAPKTEPAGQTPDADAEKAHMSTWDVAPSSVRERIQSGLASPLGAGKVVTAEPDAPQSRWTGITEELVTPGPAPLTAESVSLAFQRDGRRYDNGFPLY